MLHRAGCGCTCSQSRSEHREPHRDPGGHSNCVMKVWRWEILLQSAEHFQLPQESLSAQKCTGRGKTFISQCHSIFQFLSLNSAKLFGAEGRVFLEEAYKQVARMAWAMLPVASWVTGRERAKELQSQGKWATQGSICVYLDVSSGCLHTGPVTVGNNSCPNIRELCSKARHPAPPCKAAMNPSSLGAAIWLNTVAHHWAYE